MMKFYDTHLDDKEVNYQRVGSYDATLMVIDQSDNKTSLLITIKIQDISNLL